MRNISALFLGFLHWSRQCSKDIRRIHTTLQVAGGARFVFKGFGGPASRDGRFISRAGEISA